MSKHANEVDKKVAALAQANIEKIGAIIAKSKTRAEKAGKTEPEAYLDFMDLKELEAFVTAFLPVLKADENNPKDVKKEAKYLIGTEKKSLQIKSTDILIRVGGGYATLEEYLKQNGPFECIKIAKHMRDKKCDFKTAVEFYLNKHKAPKKVVQDWLKSDTSHAEVFEKAIEKMMDAKERRKSEFDSEQSKRKADANQKRASTMTGGNQNLDKSLRQRAASPTSGQISEQGSPKASGRVSQITPKSRTSVGQFSASIKSNKTASSGLNKTSNGLNKTLGKK